MINLIKIGFKIFFLSTNIHSDMVIANDIAENSSAEVTSASTFGGIMKKTWVLILARSAIAVGGASIFINMLIISQIIWPGDQFHAQSIGIIAGLGSWAIAFSGLLFGWIVDKFSRAKTLIFIMLVHGVGLVLNGFAPEGLGQLTFSFFLICNLIRGFAAGGIMPVINSASSDKLDEDQRSAFFGLLMAVFQLFQIGGMIASALLFQNLWWREFYWLFGALSLITAVIAAIFNDEPKRAATREELKSVLSIAGSEYNYKLNKETIKDTMLSRTNIIAFAEGILTTVLMSIPDFLLLPYLQSAPYNLSPLMTSLIMVIFGLPGGIMGSLVFAKASDKLAKKDIKNRVYLITFSLIGTCLFFFVIFFIPIPPMSINQGNSIGYLLSVPIFWVVGLMAFMGRSLMGIYTINQPPVLQSINLPEAQGTISSLNQFLESIGYGTGSLIAGSMLQFFGYNYQLTVAVTMSIGISGALMWLLALKTINKDKKDVTKILAQRAIEINGNATKSPEQQDEIN